MEAFLSPKQKKMWALAFFIRFKKNRRENKNAGRLKKSP
jgi:hypothetical protein